MGDGAAAAQTVDAAGGDSDADAMDAWGAALEEQAEVEGSNAEVEGSNAEVEGSNVVPAEPVAFDNLNSSNTGFSGEVNLDMVLDIPVTMAMELGRTQISIRNLLQLNQGSVVELDRMAGEPMDVRVNGTLIARGEVVVVNEKFGIRLTDVISAAERIKNLK
ncbi:flagellar motor switch protein FliN [Gammaproteobacteria bacterium AH-315-C21]|nr:flagellar motor switch protein FliN [Gammaproteobacteria bacterium AH-315-C21]